MRAVLHRLSLKAAEVAGRKVNAVPAVACFVTGVSGAYVRLGLGAALITASAFLFIIDRRM